MDVKAKEAVSEQVAFRQLVDKLVEEVNQKCQRAYNDILMPIMMKHGATIYVAVVARLVEVQREQFLDRYKEQLDGSAYHILGVTPDADDELVKLVYHHLAGKHHPDHGGDPKAMQALNVAYRAIAIERGWVQPMLPPGGFKGW